MKRRNADTGKMRRPIKRTKITEGIYGNSMLYLKFVMLWATVVLADYMLEFRFEFLWPFWMMLRSVYDSYKYQGLAFSVFFVCIVLTSDMICFFFIPVQYIFFAASTYVWVQYVWYTFCDKGICLPTVAICCCAVYAEGWRRYGGGAGAGWGAWRGLAAHGVGYPAAALGFGVRAYVGRRLRQRRQRKVRQENDFYFQLMRDALPESALEQNQQSAKEQPASNANGECAASASTSPASAPHERHAHTNGSLRRRRAEPNGHCPADHSHLKLDKVEKHTEKSSRERAQHALSNGSAQGAVQPDDAGCAKSSKCEKKETSTVKEEKRRSKKDKDKDKDSCISHKSTEQTKEQLVKEVESTKESVKSKECNGFKEKERDKERDRETRERERERERELREAQENIDELKRLRAELAAARSGEAEARRALQAAAAAERQRRADHSHLKQAYAALQHKLSTWRSNGNANNSTERRGRPASMTPHARTHSGECESEWCLSRLRALDAEAGSLRRELQRARDAGAQAQRELGQAKEQIRALETRAESGAGSGAGRAWAALQERASHLERSLSAETRVKLDLLSALGDAKRQIQIQDGLLSNRDKEIEELKAQMLAVMPPEFVRLEKPVSPLDPNASVYTPKQLCSDA